HYDDLREAHAAIPDPNHQNVIELSDDDDDDKTPGIVLDEDDGLFDDYDPNESDEPDDSYNETSAYFEPPKSSRRTSNGKS
ncbi:hypothetical protein KEM55_006446, partial [Ascosphaera atra]